MSEYDSILPVLAQPAVDPHTDLISLLTAAQQCEAELLTTTWQPALEPLGEGGTAEVSQSVVNRELGFAYKRINDDHSNQVHGSYKHVISELLALKSPRVSAHRNVVDLEGICWEIRNGVALPVLVFPTADLGDLRSFMQSHKGSGLDFDARLDLCVDIARGLAALHDSGIVHGDVKPQNILVHPEDDGIFLAKLSDLGYAGFDSESGFIKLPRSRPWVHPIWNRREFKIQTAKSMDVYSFGMVCLWVLFRDELLEYLRIYVPPRECSSDESIFFLSNEAPQSRLECLQASDQLASAVETIVKTSSSLKNSRPENLAKFFHAVLCKDIVKQQSDWKKLIPLLADQASDVLQVHDQPAEIAMNPPLHADFRIAACNYRLCSSDYRVRSTIFDSFQARTNSRSKIYCQTCSKMASFQLAVCYKLGFGVAKDDVMCQLHLETSSRNQRDLERELLLLRQRQLDSTYTKSNFRSLFDQGHISGENLPNSYFEQGELSSAESAYTREITDMQSVLGETHGVVLLLKSTLMRLLREGGKLQESERLGLQVMEAFQRSFGDEHPDTIVSMENLAETLTQQRLWSKACEIEERIVMLRTSEQGPNHASTLTASAKLARIYCVLGRLSEAENIDLHVVQEFTLAFGEAHQQTLEAMDGLALTLLAKEQPQESLSIRQKVLEMKSKILGNQHRSTILAKGNLAPIFIELGRWDEAETTYLEALASMRSNLGNLHEYTLTCAEKLAGAYTKAGHFENARHHQQQLIADRIAKHGEKHPKTLQCKADLAEIYANEGRLGEADEAIRAVLLEREAALASKHPDALLALSSAANVRFAQGLNDEAETLLLEVLEVEKQGSKTPSANTITNINNLATVFSQQGRLPEARDLFLEVVSAFTDTVGPAHQHTLQSSGNLARTYIRMSDFEEAEKILLTIKDIRVRNYGKDDPDSIGFAEDLSLIYRIENRWSEAEPLALELVQISTRLLGPEHLETIKRKKQLALVYKNLESWGKSEELYSELFMARKNLDGLGNMETIAAGTQLFDIYRQGENWSKAIIVLRELVDLAKEGFGPDNSTTLMCLAQLATCLAAQGDSNQAIQVHNQVVRGLKTSNVDTRRAGTLGVLGNLASKYADYGLWNESEELYVAVIEDALISLGPEHDTTLVTKANLAAVQRERGVQS